MADVALPGSIEPAAHKGPKLDGAVNPLQGIIYIGVVAAALLFVAYSIYSDVDATGTRVTSFMPYLLRLPDPDARAHEYQRFVDDLRIAGALLKKGADAA